MRISRNIASIILQVTIIVSFISIFFFVYTSHIEDIVVVKQVDNLVSSFTDDIDLIATSEQKMVFRNFFSQLKPPDMQVQDANALQNNNNLLNKTRYFVIVLLLTGLTITTFLSYYFELDVENLVKECIAGLIAVGLIEYIFLTYFVKVYKSLDPNVVKLHFVEILQNYAKS